MDDLWSDTELRNIYREFERLTSLCERTGAEVAASMVSGQVEAGCGRPLLLHRQYAGRPPPEDGDAARPAGQQGQPTGLGSAADGLALLETMGSPPPQPLHRPPVTAESAPDSRSHHGSQQQLTSAGSRQPQLTTAGNRQLTPAGSHHQQTRSTPAPTPPADPAAEPRPSNRAGRLAHLFFGRRLEQSAAPRSAAAAPPRPEPPAVQGSPVGGHQSGPVDPSVPPPRPERPARLGGANRAASQPDRTPVSTAARQAVPADSGGGCMAPGRPDPPSGSRQPAQHPGNGRPQRTERSETHSWPRPAGQLSVGSEPAAGGQGGGEPRLVQPRPPERPARRDVRQRGHPTGSSEPWQPRQPPPPPPPDSRQQLEEERRQHAETRLQLAAVQQLLRQEQEQLQKNQQLLQQEQQQHQQTQQQLAAAEQAAETVRQALRQAQQQVAATAVLRAEFVRASSAAASELDRLEERLREKETQLSELRWQLHAVRSLQLAESPPPPPPAEAGSVSRAQTPRADDTRVNHAQPQQPPPPPPQYHHQQQHQQQQPQYPHQQQSLQQPLQYHHHLLQQQQNQQQPPQYHDHLQQQKNQQQPPQYHHHLQYQQQQQHQQQQQQQQHQQQPPQYHHHQQQQEQQQQPPQYHQQQQQQQPTQQLQQLQPMHGRHGGSLPSRPVPPPRPAETLFSRMAQNRYQGDSLPGQSASLHSSEREARTMSSSLSHFGSKSSLAQSLTGSSKSAESHKAFDHYYEMANTDDKCSLEETLLGKHSFGTQQQQNQTSYSEKSMTSKKNIIRMRGTGCKQKTSTMRQMINKVFGTKQAKKATYTLSSAPMQKTRSEIGLFRGSDQPRGCSTPITSAAVAPRSFSLQNIPRSASTGQVNYHSSREEVYEDVTDSEWDCATEDEQDGSPFYINMEFNNGCLVPKGGQ